MEHTGVSDYEPPVNKLLTYGVGQNVVPDQWSNYLELGLGPEHIPELIRLATDKNLNWAASDSLEVWAPTHAWRTLGQLRAEAAIEPLLSLFEDLDENDLVMNELSEVFGMIGSAALPALAARIADSSLAEGTRISAIPSVERIGALWPEARPACAALLMKQLELFAENELEINGFLVLGLVELKATEALPLIERAFAARRVDPTIMGDWEDVQIEFGLKFPEEVDQKRSRSFLETPFPSPEKKIITRQTSTKERHQHEATHKKAKNKAASQSRKKNRNR